MNTEDVGEVGADPNAAGEPQPIADDKAKKKPLPRPDELWHSPDGEAWATIGGISLAVEGRDFRDWLSQKLFRRDKEAPSRNLLDKLVAAFAAEARFDGFEHETNLRTARFGETVWLDLGDQTGRAVAIEADNWQLVRAAPVKFWRPPTMRPLPEPLRAEADIWLLRDLLNIADDDTLRMVLTWLSFAIRPGMQYPVLEIGGEPGSAKTMGARFLRNLVDPAMPALRGAPKGSDLIACAKNNAIVAFDNLSGIAAAMADDICRLSTGGGFGGRQFYTEDKEKVFDATRPVIINGVGDLATRGDMADRTLEVRLERVTSYRGAEEMQEAFDYAQPRILAGLLDMVAAGLARLDDVRRGPRDDLTRMADFGLWGRAVALALGWTAEDFAFAHQQDIKSSANTALDNDAVAPFLVEFLETRGGRWSGRPHELWGAIKERHVGRPLPDSFPRSPEGMGWALRRLAPQLRRRAVEIAWPPKGNRHQPIVITMPTRP